MFLEASMGRLQTHKNFFQPNVYFFFSQKNYRFNILRFFYNNLLLLINHILCHCKAINNHGNKWLLLDVNPKTRFLEVKKILKALKLKKKMFFDLVIKLLIIFGNNKFFCDKSVQTYVKQKFCLWTPFLNKCSECEIY